MRARHALSMNIPKAFTLGILELAVLPCNFCVYEVNNYVLQVVAFAILLLRLYMAQICKTGNSLFRRINHIHMKAVVSATKPL